MGRRVISHQLAAQPEAAAPVRLTGTAGRLSLRRNFVWSFGGNAVYAACQWGLLVVLAQLEGARAVGLFSLGLAITAPVIMFANLQLRTVQATDARDDYTFHQYLALRLVTTALALGAIAAITFAAGYEAETALVILLIGLGKSFDAVADICFGLFQRREQMDVPALALGVNGLLSIAVLALATLLTGSIVWAAAAWAAASALTLVYAARAVTRLDQGDEQAGMSFRPDWKPSPLLALARLALPLGIVLLFISLMTSVPRYIIEDQSGVTELGIFAGIAYVVVAGDVMMRALSQAAIPRLATYFAEQNRSAFTSLTLRLVAIGAAGGALGVVATLLVGEPALRLIYGEEYAQHTDVLLLTVIAAGILFVASFLGAAMTAAHRYAVQTPIFAGLLLLTIILSLWLIPEHGIQGAAVTLVLVAVAQVVCCGLIVLRVVHSLGDGETG
jgi:O-antigen/teichoic acid export membrane protein